jgi:hypothetical protein
MTQQECYYSLRARIVFQNAITGQLDFQNIEHKFENENPIVAREAVFNDFDNYIHGLLLGIGVTENELKNISDKEVRKLLNSYIDPKTSRKVKFLGAEIEMPDYIGNGIWIEMIINNDEQNKLTVHLINQDNADMPIPSNLLDLEKEFEFYEVNNYDKKSFSKTVLYFDIDEYEDGYTETALGEHKILETPFDWSGYDKIFWWGKPDNKETPEDKQENTTKDLLPPMETAFLKGEHEFVEFKPGLINRPSSVRNIELEVAKTICAFSNSKGGYLFIGIADRENKVYGIQFNRISKDEFLREFTRIKTTYLPKSIAFSTYGDFYQADNKTIFVITVQPSLYDPVFLWTRDNNNKVLKEFYVRSDAASARM